MRLVLVTYPFSDVSAGKVRPAVVVSAAHASHDLFVVPLTSRTSYLLAGEFVLGDWAAAGLNVPSAAKRGVYTIHESLVIKRIGQLTTADGEHLRQSADAGRNAHSQWFASGRRALQNRQAQLRWACEHTSNHRAD